MESRWLSLAALCAGTLMIILDQTVVNVALPAIAADLGFTASGLAWVVNAYLIPFGGLLLLAGRLGDLLGRKRVFLAGLAVFTVASLLCGLAWSPEVLLVARLVQGVGGAVSSAVILGMIVTLFPEARDRAKALGVYSFVQAAGGSIGSLAGGVLTQSASWHWIFLINLPIGVATFVAAARFLDAERGSGKGADGGSAVLVTAALMLGVYTIVEAASWIFGAVSVALLTAFVIRQARVPNPLLPLRILTSRSVAGANVVQVLLIAAMFGFQFLVVLYLQRVLGYDSMQAGLSMLPVAVAIGAVSLGLSARLNTRFGARRVLIAGLGLIFAGMVLLSRAPIDAGFVPDVLPAMLALGIGFGTAMPALMVLAMSDATPEDSGLTSGLVNTTAQVGGALGLSVLAVLAATRTAGGTTPEALLSGYHLGFTVGAVLVAAALVTAVVWGRRTTTSRKVVLAAQRD
ncbi:MFS transporter [Allokutzneria sp. A3M-2-11 16]|uniref:MFS transporter n=1 Tax=Allokutzneria sp. A3M-2-11 16 TaxID=2962043 RepID=UPI0020B77F2A|nr:MFS transporter [Allokutzneria sp. A3M-2-11 16]MCP3799209.1 MFS transporter [Allokutzneria sp. A3M-2-11 16]